MNFNPIDATNKINAAYKSYVKNTFLIKDCDFQKLYNNDLDNFKFAKGPYLDSVDAFKTGKSLKEMVEEKLLASEFNKLFINSNNIYTRPLYLHQENAIKNYLADKNMVVTTGTGSGKTECFLYPILDYLLKQKALNGELSQGVRVLLLYPMNALANDQMKRLRSVLKDYKDITFGSYTGETETTKKDALDKYRSLNNSEPLQNEIISREEMQLNPPHIFITNYAMLEYLLIRPKDNVFFSGTTADKWKFIVLDEAHVYTGAIGMEVSILLRRLYHKLPNNDKIRFILTSATLGDEKQNDKICKFASSLCAETEFKPENIIRAQRREFQQPNNCFTGTLELYQKIAKILKETTSEENISVSLALDSIASKYCDTSQFDKHDYHEYLYSFFCKDKFYYLIRQGLEANCVKLKDLATSMKVDEKLIVEFVNVVSYAWHNGGKLLDARYHHFVSTMEGAYVTFYPKKTLSLTPRKHCVIDGITTTCFKISVCQFCGTIYLQGKFENGLLSQKNQNEYFMVVDKDFVYSPDDEIEEANVKISKTYVLDTSSSNLRQYTKNQKLKPEDILVYHCKPNNTDGDDDDGMLHKCDYCNSVNPHGNIIKGFFLGQDATASVIGDSLYKEIIPVKTILKKATPKSKFNKKTTAAVIIEEKKLLIFSDSRQDAAYFASYFQYTHDLINNRRLLVKSIRDTNEEILSGAKINDTMYQMKSLLSNKGMTSIEANKKAWLVLFSEFKNFTRNNLIGSGWFTWDLPNWDFFEDDELNLEEDESKEKVIVTKEELIAITKMIITYCLNKGAISYPKDIELTAEDRQDNFFSKKQTIINLENLGLEDSLFELKTLIPTYNNTILDYLTKGGIDKNHAQGLISDIFKEILIHEDNQILTKCTLKNTSSYWVNTDKLILKIQDKAPFNLYRCSECGRLTTINFRSKCPTYHCKGTLEKCDFQLMNKDDNYFIKQYGSEQEYEKMKIVEHTAQLSNKTAASYQSEFLSGNINALSCSTTFEMGVDVGELETVYMKNMPPSPANYIQRAGRAGRRLESASYALTFCRLASHDFYYFENPEEMIKGKIAPPIFKIDNIKIVSRHIYAILLSLYWKQFPEIKEIKDFFDPNTYKLIIDYCKNQLTDQDLAYIRKVVPNTIPQIAIYNIISDYCQINLKRVYDCYNRSKQELENYKEDLREESTVRTGLYPRIDYIEKVIKTLTEEQIIVVYSKNNLIPKYGFPIDTVELKTSSYDYKHEAAEGLSLQRDLSRAIVEYAPGAEIIANGNIYTSRYILKPQDSEKTWTVKNKVECETCHNIIDVGLLEKDIVCPKCQNKITTPIQKVLMPNDGFFFDSKNIVKATTKKPRKNKISDFYYVGDKDNTVVPDTNHHNLNGHDISVISSPNDQIFVRNNRPYFVCNSCGYAVSKKKDFKAHNTIYNKACTTNKPTTYYLGHEFLTDVVVLHFDFLLTEKEVRTLMYSLIEGCSRYYEIERNDINGCISFTNYTGDTPKGFNIILFDSIPGGAGNVKRIWDSTTLEFREYLEKCLSIVKNCDCGDNGDGEAVCYHCLCNYTNQKYHEIMKRRYAIDILEELLK